MTHGTPRTATRAVPRLMLQIITTPAPTSATRTILIAVRLAGGATRPWRRLAAARSQRAVPTAPTTTARATQPAMGTIRPWTRSYMTRWLGTEELTLTVPLAPPRTTTRIPEKSRNIARLTTKDGILSRAVSVPVKAPIRPQIASAASIAAHHGQAGPGCWTSLNAITPPKSATAPTERSISPRSRTTVSAIASTMYTVLSPKI